MNFGTEIHKILEGYRKNEAGIVGFRHSKLSQIYEYFKTYGYPRRCEKVELSIIPGIFQEANYDDINWTDKDEDLRHLKTVLEIDCMFQNDGRMRAALTEDEFKEYIKFSFMAIKTVIENKKI